MSGATHEVLILCDRNHGDFWHLHPQILDVEGWWPDGSPAWIDDDPDELRERRTVIEVIPKRQPMDDDWLEDDPRVYRLINLACTLNDIFLPMRGSRIAAAHETGNAAAVAEAILTHIKTKFKGGDVDWVFRYGTQVEAARKVAA